MGTTRGPLNTRSSFLLRSWASAFFHLATSKSPSRSPVQVLLLLKNHLTIGGLFSVCNTLLSFTALNWIYNFTAKAGTIHLLGTIVYPTVSMVPSPQAPWVSHCERRIGTQQLISLGKTQLFKEMEPPETQPKIHIHLTGYECDSERFFLPWIEVMEFLFLF